MTTLILTFSQREKELLPVCLEDNCLAASRAAQNKLALGSPLPFWGEGEGEGRPMIPIALRKDGCKRIRKKNYFEAGK